jgi:hypothetical protein
VRDERWSAGHGSFAASYALPIDFAKLKSQLTLSPGSGIMVKSSEGRKGVIEGIVGALRDQHSELEVRLGDLTLRLPGTPFSVQLTGTLNASVHMRELTDKEKEAYATANIAHLHA